MELQGLLLKNCQRKLGLIVRVDEGLVDIINLDGRTETIEQSSIETVYIFDVIENPFATFHIDEKSLGDLKGVYLENSAEPSVYAFPVRFVEDLLIFYSLDGKTHVHTLNDIYRLRPAPPNLLGPHPTKSSKSFQFLFSDSSSKCPWDSNKPGVSPTRVLADQISITEYLHSLEQGYERLDSFEERTYLYARPYLFPKRSRLGLMFSGAREEPGLNLPLFFQWSSGESYRFQSYNVVGLKSHEFTPNTEPVFSVRSDVKSHLFHASFIGNVVGLPAGNSIFLRQDFMKLDDDFSVQPSFNYIAMMGGDYGPYSVSVGFYYPTFGFRVDQERREILASSLSYLFEFMYTTSHWKFRAAGATVHRAGDGPSNDDVLARAADTGDFIPPNYYQLNSTFIRPGIDYDISEDLRTGIDLTILNGNYSEVRNGFNNSIRFNKATLQGYVQRTFGNYVSLSAFVNLIQKDYDSSFSANVRKKSEQGTVFFGSPEFMF